MNRTLDMLARTLVIIGALNWGLVAIARFDLVAEIFGLDFGGTNTATRIVYGLVGLSGLWLVTRMFSPTARAEMSTDIPHRRAA